MGDVFEVLRENRKGIVAKADKGTRWETRRNALETMRKICKSIMLCDVQVIRHELMKDGQVLAEFMEDMITLAQGMSERERKKYEEEALLEKLVELKDYGDWETNMPLLEVLLRVFGVGGEIAAAKSSPAKKLGGQVIINLDDESESEVDEDEHDKALKAFDRARGCNCHDMSPKHMCPIHKI